jgi:hypothetical protein
MTKTLSALICVAFLSACATPTVVQTRQVQDDTLNCVQLRSAYDEAENYEKRARDERGVTGKNAAAVILFWPALIGTYLNTDDAIKAARERKDHLSRLMVGKKCSAG